MFPSIYKLLFFRLNNFIRNIIAEPLNINYIALLLIGKLFLTVICIRLNLFGGIFSPALFLGVSIGCIFATLFQFILPDLNYSLFVKYDFRVKKI